MSRATIDKPALVTMCDICKKEIAESTSPLDKGSLIAGYIAHPVTPKTKRAWLIWPPRDRPGFGQTHQERRAESLRSKQYDFHGECITKLVEEAAS